MNINLNINNEYKQFMNIYLILLTRQKKSQILFCMNTASDIILDD